MTYHTARPIISLMTYKNIIALWPSMKALSTDLAVKHETVIKWRLRDSIPAKYWSDLIEAANDRGLDVTLKQLADIENENS